MIRLTKKQSVAVDELIISAVMEHGIIKPRHIFELLSKNRQASQMSNRRHAVSASPSA